ncbi:hypothetical protein RHGRI_010755 [Rhododendron griersonianum]|uniref:Uncharacterized protein n=1 Tax=Rhododendron griersonianum TaxID=479676 RepID=A0AAV6KKH4_9ERIC|nr:hypothetical protein RHGRI_010755 [Rhododendron griersonianum]
MDPALIAEIQNFKDIHHTVLDHLINDPYFAHQFLLLDEYYRNFGVWPPLDVLVLEEEPAEEEPEEEEPKEPEEEELEEPEEEELEKWENEEEPEVQANVWLNDHGMAEQEQDEIEAIPEEEPKPVSDVEDPEPTPVTMNLLVWGPWHRHLAKLEENTFAYVSIAHLHPCSWKPQPSPFYLGPLLILRACITSYYVMDVPKGYEYHFSNQVLFTRVTPI